MIIILRFLFSFSCFYFGRKNERPRLFAITLVEIDRERPCLFNSKKKTGFIPKWFHILIAHIYIYIYTYEHRAYKHTSNILLKSRRNIYACKKTKQELRKGDKNNIHKVECPEWDRSCRQKEFIYIYIYYIFLCPLRWGEMLLLAATELSCLLKVVVQLLYRKDYDSITVFSYWLVAFPPFFFGLFSHHHLSVSILKRMTGKKKICLMAYF